MKRGGKLSFFFRLLHRIGVIGNEERYGHLSVFSFIKFAVTSLYRRLIFNYAYKAYILEPFYKKRLRPAIWRRLGCDVGKNVHIGHQVRLDFGNSERIHVGDDVVISNGVTILCHKRDVSNYQQGKKATQLSFIYDDVV